MTSPRLDDDLLRAWREGKSKKERALWREGKPKEERAQAGCKEIDWRCQNPKCIHERSPQTVKSACEARLVSIPVSTGLSVSLACTDHPGGVLPAFMVSFLRFH